MMSRRLPSASLLAFTAALSLGAGLFSGVAQAREVEEVYRAKCKSCHGDDGKGKTKHGIKHKAPDMSSAEWQKKHDDAEILDAITNGSKEPGSKMKAYKDKLSAEEIEALVGYVRKFAKP